MLVMRSAHHAEAIDVDLQQHHATPRKDCGAVTVSEESATSLTISSRRCTSSLFYLLCQTGELFLQLNFANVFSSLTNMYTKTLRQN